jgi:hypothetical protein
VAEVSQNALATCLGHLGVLSEAAGDPVTAAVYLAEACGLYAEAGEAGPLMDLQAVEARCVLALGRRDEAARLAAEVWAYLRDVGIVMIDFPSRVYVCLADVMAAVETPELTLRDVLKAGYDDLMRSAERIEDPDWRRSFMEEELSNRTLLARWKAYNR